MIPKQIIARSMMFACVLLSACGHSGEENPQPGKPEPEKPVEEENYLTVTTRNGAPVESYEQSFAAFAQTLVVRSNVKWEVSAGNAAAWLHVEATSAATAEVAIEVNTGREVRSGTIVFTTTDPKVRVEIPVRQNFGETIGLRRIRRRTRIRRQAFRQIRGFGRRRSAMALRRISVSDGTPRRQIIQRRTQPPGFEQAGLGSHRGFLPRRYALDPGARQSRRSVAGPDRRYVPPPQGRDLHARTAGGSDV